MDTVIVQLPETTGSPGTAPRLLRMGPDESAEFGRGSPGRPVPIPLPDQGVSRRAGELTAAADYWRLSNFSRSATYVVENLEGAGEHVKVAPGRLGAPVPFEFSRVVLPSLGGGCHFKVFAPQHAYLDRGPAGPRGEHTVSPFALDATAKYFLVLVALCEPRLRGTSAAVPGVGDVVDRLGGGPDGQLALRPARLVGGPGETEPVSPRRCLGRVQELRGSDPYGVRPHPNVTHPSQGTGTEGACPPQLDPPSCRLPGRAGSGG